MPPIPPFAWAALAAVVSMGLVWLGWTLGPGKQIRALELEQARLRGIVEGTGWGDDYLKTQHVRGLFGKRTTLDVGKKGPF
jgi:hypothetical protein